MSGKALEKQYTAIDAVNTAASKEHKAASAKTWPGGKLADLYFLESFDSDHEGQ